jgi:hypothetical protein
MLMQIVTHTPPWVWGLLAALIALGLSQAVSRRMSLVRVTVLPLVLLVLSLAGVLSTFPHMIVPLAAWAAGLLVALAAGRSLVRPRGARWDAGSASFHVPGSWLPLALILALFMLKYTVGVALALQPGLGRELGFDASVGAAYGLFSGLFLARAASLWQLARAPRAIAA